jgi:hypothetical protein
MASKRIRGSVEDIIEQIKTDLCLGDDFCIEFPFGLTPEEETDVDEALLKKGFSVTRDQHD